VSTEPSRASDGSTYAAAAAASSAASPGGGTSDVAAKVQERPELAVGGAFAGGMILALVLKRLAR
jgi:hypothetical protein